MATQTNGTLQHVENGLLVYVIADLANGNQTPAIDLGLRAPELSFSAGGALGTGGSVQLEASNDKTNWSIVGAAVTALSTVDRTTAARYVRFNVTAGDGATLFDITLVAHPTRG